MLSKFIPNVPQLSAAQLKASAILIGAAIVIFCSGGGVVYTVVKADHKENIAHEREMIHDAVDDARKAFGNTVGLMLDCRRAQEPKK